MKKKTTKLPRGQKKMTDFGVSEREKNPGKRSAKKRKIQIMKTRVESVEMQQHSEERAANFPEGTLKKLQHFDM